MNERPPTITRDARPGRFLALMLASILALSMLVGCDQQKFGDAEQHEVQRVLQTGVDLSSDPYMQAETMRVLGIIGQPSLNHLAEQLITDQSDPMVRVAALRVLLANDYKDAANLATTRFDRAETPEKHAILDAAYQLGSPQLRRVLVSRALGSEDADLRRDAFIHGPLERLEQAQAQDKTMYLRDTLFPELGQFIDEQDPDLAAAALKALMQAGEEDRATPLLDTLKDPDAAREKRLAAARILGMAEVKQAMEPFEQILRSVRVSANGELVVPRRIDRELARQATLGMVACGDTELVLPVQKYLENADAAETIEVLRALSTNPSPDALVSLKVAMQDAREQVREHAIDFYLAHPDARGEDLIEVMGRSDFDTQKRLAHALADAYPRVWARHLSNRLGHADSSVQSLEFLWNILLGDEQIQVLEHLKEPLSALAQSEHEKAAPLAALLLVKVKDDPQLHQLLRTEEDPAIRYAYLEHLAREAPRENVDFFRENMHTDLHALRLMSAAGMLLAFEAGAPSRNADPDPGSQAVAVGDDDA